MQKSTHKGKKAVLCTVSYRHQFNETTGQLNKITFDWRLANLHSQPNDLAKISYILTTIIATVSDDEQYKLWVIYRTKANKIKMKLLRGNYPFLPLNRYHHILFAVHSSHLILVPVYHTSVIFESIF